MPKTFHVKGRRVVANTIEEALDFIESGTAGAVVPVALLSAAEDLDLHPWRPWRPWDEAVVVPRTAPEVPEASVPDATGDSGVTD